MTSSVDEAFIDGLSTRVMTNFRSSMFPLAFIQANPGMFLTNDWINVDQLRQFVARSASKSDVSPIKTEEIRVKLEDEAHPTRSLAHSQNSAIKGTRISKENGKEVIEILSDSEIPDVSDGESQLHTASAATRGHVNKKSRRPFVEEIAEPRQSKKLFPSTAVGRANPPTDLLSQSAPQQEIPLSAQPSSAPSASTAAPTGASRAPNSATESGAVSGADSAKEVPAPFPTSVPLDFMASPVASDTDFVDTIITPLVESDTLWQDQGLKSQVRVGAFRVTKEVTVQRVKYLNFLPSLYPILLELTAIVVDLSHPKYNIEDDKKQLRSMDALIKNKDNDSWKGNTGTADSKVWVTFEDGADPIQCRRSRLKCSGSYFCEQVDQTLINVERRYLDPATRDAVFEAQRQTRRDEGTTTEKRVAEMIKIMRERKCPAKGCSGVPILKKKAQVAPEFIKLCHTHAKRAVLDFKSLVPEQDYKRIMDFVYLDSDEELAGFSEFIGGLGVKKIQDWWNHKHTSAWILPCLLKSQSRMNGEHWDQTPATTNTGEGQHHNTNLHTGIKLSLVEAAETARKLDLGVAREIEISMKTGILLNSNNESAQRRARNATRQSSIIQKSHESHELADERARLAIQIEAGKAEQKRLAARLKEIRYGTRSA
ncbi:hypothetical protein B0H10DRAFT_2090007 [Mycena sp. CBHHK59/15]|nr:hypothetical protein B0H10DRAFT_2090007 [Mycena sp. CBHHK59/15]